MTRPHYGYLPVLGDVEECAEWCPGCHDEGVCDAAGDCDYCDDPTLIAGEVAAADAVIGATT